jgi:NADP-dependent 3-hydroxy acid dehydrogenase YdfG
MANFYQTQPIMPPFWFITGCSSGFGRQLDIAAAQNDDKPIAISRDPSKLHELKDRVIHTKLDIGNEAETKAAVDNVGYILEGAIEECR